MTHNILCLAAPLSRCRKSSEYVDPQTLENTWVSGPTSDNGDYDGDIVRARSQVVPVLDR